MIVQIMPARV